jgi:glycosyltransferase involved in cell wall biosynthesis
MSWRTDVSFALLNQGLHWRDCGDPCCDHVASHKGGGVVKIALLVYRLNGISGVSKHALMLARELVTMGHSVDIWAVECDKAACPPDLTRGLTIHSLRAPKAQVTQDADDVPAGKRMMSHLGQLWKAYTDQRNLFQALPPGYDVINPHGDHVQWAAAAYKQRYGTPAVWMCNDFWIAAGQRADVTETGELPSLNANGKPRTGELKAGGRTGKTDKLRELARQPLVYPFERYDRWSVSQMDSIVVLSERVKAQMQAHYGVSAVVIRTGIGTPDLTQNTQRRPGQTFRLLTVCTLMPRRRIEDVLQALALLQETEKGTPIPLHYTVVGRGDHTPSYMNFLYDEVDRLNLRGRVTFTGEVPDDQLATYFELCDAFVWAADEGQSWGMACMEAMAYGKPVLVSKANGLAEVLVDGEDALLFSVRNPKALSEALWRLMSSRMLRKQIAVAGQRLVREQYSWRANAEAMMRLFEEATRKGKMRPLHEVFPMEVP